MNRYILQAANKILSPVAASPFFFMAASLLGGIAPVAFQLTHSGRIFRFMSYTVSQSAVAGYLMCVILLFYNRRWLKALVLSVLTVYAFAECMIIAGVDRPIDYECVALLLDTNANEATGFIAEFYTWHTVLIPILSICLVYAAANGFGRLYRKFTGSAVGTLAAAAILAGLLIFGTVRFTSNLTILNVPTSEKLMAWEFPDPDATLQMSRRNQTKFADIYTKTFTIAKTIRLFLDDSDRWADTQEKVTEMTHTDRQPTDSLDIVFVMGESFIRNHSSLYGYNLETNPCLAAEMRRGNLVRLDDMATTSGYTHEVMHNTLNLNDLSKRQPWAEGAYWPLIFHAAGWEVYLYENQSAERDAELGITAMLYHPIAKNAYDGGSSRLFEYDGDFVTYVADSVITSTQGIRRFEFWHLTGQHYNASDRFPDTSANRKWDASDITVQRPWLDEERRKAIADYDNATLYNDRQVTRIIDLYRQRNAIIVYTSDHGEEMWDMLPSGARKAQHPENPLWIRQIYTIPAFIWMSDKYIASHPASADAIKNAAGRPLWLDNIGHTLLALGSVDTPCYNPQLDWFSESYAAPRRISSEGYDLDKDLGQ